MEQINYSCGCPVTFDTSDMTDEMKKAFRTVLTCPAHMDPLSAEELEWVKGVVTRMGAQVV